MLPLQKWFLLNAVQNYSLLSNVAKKQHSFTLYANEKIRENSGKMCEISGKVDNSNEFENIAGVPVRKWKNSIKHDGKPLGEWLAQNMLVESPQTSSQTQVSCQLETQLENQQLQGDANHTYSDNDLVTDNGQGCQVELDISASTNVHESSTMVPSNTQDSLSCLDFDSSGPYITYNLWGGRTL